MVPDVTGSSPVGRPRYLIGECGVAALLLDRRQAAIAPPLPPAQLTAIPIVGPAARRQPAGFNRTATTWLPVTSAAYAPPPPSTQAVEGKASWLGPRHLARPRCALNAFTLVSRMVGSARCCKSTLSRLGLHNPVRAGESKVPHRGNQQVRLLRGEEHQARRGALQPGNPGTCPR